MKLKIDDMFKRIEKYVQLDLKYFIKNGSYLLFSHIISASSMMALSIVLARSVSKEIYGEYKYILSILGLLSIFTLPGINTAIFQAVARGYDNIFIEGTKVRIKWGLIGVVLTFGISVYYFLEGSTRTSAIFLICALFFPFYFSLNTYDYFLSARKSFDKVFKYRSVYSVVSALSTIVAIWYFRDLIIIVFIYIISGTLTYLFYFIRTKTKEKLNDKVDNHAISYGKHLTLISLLSHVQLYYDKIIVSLFIGFSEVAIYSIANTLASQIYGIGKIVGTLAFPILARQETNNAYFAIRKRIISISLLIILMSVIGVFLSPFIIPFFYSIKYLEAIIYAQLLFIIIILKTIAIILYRVQEAQKQKTKIYQINITTTLAEILLLTTLLPLYGLMGLVIAKAISNTYNLMINIWNLKQ